MTSPVSPGGCLGASRAEVVKHLHEKHASLSVGTGLVIWRANAL